MVERDERNAGRLYLRSEKRKIRFVFATRLNGQRRLMERLGEKNRKGMMTTQPHPTKEVTENIKTY